MKKIIAILFLFFVITSVNAIEVEIDMGVGTQFSGAKGTLVYTKDFWKDSTAVIEHDSNLNFYSWMELRTNKKYWPKMRIEISRLVTEGISDIDININSSITQGLVNQIKTKFPTLDITNFYTSSKLEQNSYELYLYYEYFENREFPTIGIGGGAKYFDFAYNALVIIIPQENQIVFYKV